ncbi:MAG: hypothetical protein H0X27_04460 [Caulobacteraceae bacterium]|nr:hypothetical protein [Caulobacteraceae bacterium]
MVEEKQELLTPEQQSMWKRQHRDDKSKSASPEQKKAWNRDLRQKLESMSPADLAKTRMSLQAEWDAQPAEQKEKKQQRLAEKAKKSADKSHDDDDD